MDGNNMQNAGLWSYTDQAVSLKYTENVKKEMMHESSQWYSESAWHAPALMCLCLHVTQL